jgi:hypothetical protein
MKLFAGGLANLPIGVRQRIHNIHVSRKLGIFQFSGASRLASRNLEQGSVAHIPQ